MMDNGERPLPPMHLPRICWYCGRKFMPKIQLHTRCKSNCNKLPKHRSQ